MDYGAHLPVIDFGFQRFSLEWLTAYVQTARDLGFRAVSTNDHLIHSRPWLDAPTALTAILSHSGNMAVGTSILLSVVRGPVQVAKTMAAIDIVSNGRLIVGVGPGSSVRDYEIVGLDYEERWKRFDESVQAYGHFGLAMDSPDGFIPPRASISNPNRCKNRRRPSGSLVGARTPACAGSRAWEMDGWRRPTTQCRINSGSA